MATVAMKEKNGANAEELIRATEERFVNCFGAKEGFRSKAVLWIIHMVGEEPWKAMKNISYWRGFS